MTLHIRPLVPQSRAPQQARMSPFLGMLPLSYDLILADPPWQFENWSTNGEWKSANMQYETQGIDWICSLPVSELCRGDALLVMWTTWPILMRADAPAHRVMKAWGFKPRTGGAWFKRSRVNAMPWQGTGYVLRSACEPFLIGTMGEPLIKAQRGMLESFADMDVIDAKIREHSRKPDEIYGMCERIVPHGLKAAELFARQRHQGERMEWHAWGNETEKFEAPAISAASTSPATPPAVAGSGTASPSSGKTAPRGGRAQLSPEYVALATARGSLPPPGAPPTLSVAPQGKSPRPAARAPARPPGKAARKTAKPSGKARARKGR